MGVEKIPRADKVAARFLAEQCEMGPGFEVSEAILLVVFSGWCKLQREKLPDLASALQHLERAGVKRRDGKMEGIRLRGIDEQFLSELLGPSLYEYVQTLDWCGVEEGSSAEAIEPERPSGIDGDSVATFLERCCSRLAHEDTPAKELHEAYLLYCNLKGRKPVKEERFLMTLRSPKLQVGLAGGVVRGVALKREFLASMLSLRIDARAGDA